MAKLELRSEDRAFGVQIAQRQLDLILGACRKAGRAETGGLLIGTYSKGHDVAIVSNATKAPRDSASGYSWFQRGVAGLQQVLGRLWRRGAGYYLGEWHFHPFGSPTPSSVDTRQMCAIARDAKYRCPEPVLVIVGGDPGGCWSIGAFVFPAGSRPRALLPSHDCEGPLSGEWGKNCQ